MSEIMTVTVPQDQHDWRPDPFPGSEIAFRAGCKCPERQPWPGALRFAADCPVHEMEMVRS